MVEADIVDPFEVLGVHEGILRDHVRAVVHLQLGLPYTNRPHQELRQRVHGDRVIGIRAPRDGWGQYTWAAGAAGRIVLHQLLDHIRTTEGTILSHRQLRALFATAAFSEQTCLRQLRRLCALTVEISNGTGAVLDRQSVGSYSESGFCVSEWVASAVHALPALPSPATVREVAMAQRWGWRSGATVPTSPMPIDLLLWLTHVAPQVRSSAVVPGLRVTLTGSTLILTAARRCDVAVYGVDSAFDRRFSRLCQGPVIAGSR